MDNSQSKKKISRKRRVFRVRKKLRGTKDKPRLSVFRSNCHLYAQLIDDETSHTLCAATTLSKEISDAKCRKKSKIAAEYLGNKIAELAKEKNIAKVVFDRGRMQYHGLIAALADAARKAGLQF